MLKKDTAIYKTNYYFDIRHLLAQVSTNSYFNLSIDLMLRDPSLVSGSHIIRLIYSFDSTSDKQDESLNKVQNKDLTFEIIYKINGFKSVELNRNICLDACKGLALKCDNCLKPLNETMILNNGSLHKHALISQYFKVYQIRLKGEGKIVNGSLNEIVPSYGYSKLAADYFVQSQNKITGGGRLMLHANLMPSLKYS